MVRVLGDAAYCNYCGAGRGEMCPLTDRELAMPEPSGIRGPMPEKLDQLRKIAANLDSSLLVGSNEVQPLLSALLYSADFGEELDKAADEGAQAVSDLIAPPVTPQAGAGEGSPAPSLAEQLANLTDAERSDLVAVLQTRQATSQATQVEHETGASATEEGVQE